MSKNKFLPRIAVATLLVGSLFASSAHAIQFTYLDPAYEQDIYTGALPTGWGPGFAWSSSGNMVLRGNSTLYEYSLTDDIVVSGTDVHSFITRPVANLGSGYGMTNGTDGFVYANTSRGVQQIDLSTWSITQTFNTSARGTYGIGTLPDGRIVHNDSYKIWILDPTTGVDTMIYNHGSFVDDIAISPTQVYGFPGGARSDQLDGLPRSLLLATTTQEPPSNSHHNAEMPPSSSLHKRCSPEM